MGRKIQIILAFALCVLLAASPSFARHLKQKKSEEDEEKIVRLIKGNSLELIEIDERPYRKATMATFEHNGMTLICDTALWDVNNEMINAYGNVRLIQGEVTLTSDKLDYLIAEDLAQFRGSLVQLQDKKNNILRTNNLDYNTKDSIAIFRDGGSMKSSDGQVMEGVEGTYFSSKKLFTFVEDVNMYTDSVFIKTYHIDYHSDTKRAYFESDVDFWKEDNMLSSKWGWYDRPAELFYFQGKVHGLTKEQEGWCDSMYYYRNCNNVLMLGDAQMQDTTRNTIVVGRRVFYEDSLSRLTLTDQAAAAIQTEHDNKTDTLFCGADTLIYWALQRKDIPENEFTDANARLEDLNADPVSAYRQKAAEERKKKEDEQRAALQEQGLMAPPPGAGPGKGPGKGPRKGPGAGPEEGPGDVPDSLGTKPPQIVPETAETDSLGTKPPQIVPETAETDSLGTKTPEFVPETAETDSLGTETPEFVPEAAVADTTAIAPVDTTSIATATDSLATQTDSLVTATDTLSTQTDTLATATDSLATQVDSTQKFGFAIGLGNVRMFREDMQMRCDSMRYTDIDSVARFYKDPIIWNEGYKQYSADSLHALIMDGTVDRISMLSNAMVITQEDTICYDQIFATEIMAYFNKQTQLRRFDALGGCSSMFFLEENGELATVNKVDSKMMSALLENGEVQSVSYYDNTKNDGLPLSGLTRDDLYIKGFNWNPDDRPMRREDVTTLKLKKSERRKYMAKEHPAFRFSEVYFPGYMKGVFAQIELAKIEKQRRKHIQDSLAALPPVDSLALSDSLKANADSLSISDSLKMAGDSLALSDSLKMSADSLNLADSLGTASDTLKATPSAKELRAEERRKAAEKREAEKNARWAELDRKDAERKAAKEERKLKNKREKTRKALINQEKQEARDAARLQKYIEKLEKRKAREEARALKKKVL